MAKNRKHLPYHDAHIDKAMFHPYCNPPRWRALKKQKFRRGSNVTQNQWYEPKPLPINKYLAVTNDEVTCVACTKAMLSGHHLCDTCGDMIFAHQAYCDACLRREPLSEQLLAAAEASDGLQCVCAMCGVRANSEEEINDFFDVPLCKSCEQLAANMLVANGASELYRNAILEYRAIAKKLDPIEAELGKRLSEQRSALQAKLKSILKENK